VNPKLQFLIETVALEAQHLLQTDGRLFQQPMTEARVLSLPNEPDLAERVDAFVARFGRLQDTVADKLLPELLKHLAEPVGPALDNLNKAERFGWLASVDDWLVVRKLRNRMIHEYVRDATELAQALQAAHEAVPLLVNAAEQMARSGHV
jgi:Asp-tRNA(Asn)/Glu-tRNA(Gln) amidotransferase A subunit family amidase